MLRGFTHILIQEIFIEHLLWACEMKIFPAISVDKKCHSHQCFLASKCESVCSVLNHFSPVQLFTLPALAGGLFTTSATWEARQNANEGSPNCDPADAATLCVDCWGAGAMQEARWTKKQDWPQIAEVYMKGMNTVSPETWLFRLPAPFVANSYIAWLPLLPPWSSFLRATEMLSPCLQVLSFPTW